MSEHEDRMAEALQRTLSQHADEAPSDAGLVGSVRAGVRRRRRQRQVTVLATAVTAAAAVSVGVVWLNAPEPTPAPVAQPAWTTVTYQDVQVRVPAGWRVDIEPLCGPTPKEASSRKASACKINALSGSDRPNSLVLRDAQLASADSAAGGKPEPYGSRQRADLDDGLSSSSMVLGDVLITVYAKDADRLERVLEQARRVPR